jgi:hypothetical protein
VGVFLGERFPDALSVAEQKTEVFEIVFVQLVNASMSIELSNKRPRALQDPGLGADGDVHDVWKAARQIARDVRSPKYQTLCRSAQLVIGSV